MIFDIYTERDGDRMKKHAYLIMAYNNPEQLVTLINLLDDPRNDIFIHIDKDADFPMDTFDSLKTKSKLFVVPRVSVRWAQFSQVEAEVMLLSCATQTDSYHYYHLLSGMDLPIKTQDEIHSFFADKDFEFIGIVPTESKYNLRHVMCRYPLLRLKSYRKIKLLRYLSEGFASVQMFFYDIGIGGKNRKVHKNGLKFYDGWQWFSITDDFARYFLSRKEEVAKMFSKAKAPDEMVLQTIIMDSPFAWKIYDSSSLTNGSMRHIDWNRGKPYVFRKDDFDELMASPCMFARKIDQRVDADIIRMLSDRLLSDNR